MTRLHSATAVFCLFSGALAAQSGNPNFSGHWELNAARSAFGRMPPPDRVVEVIDHKGPNLVINSVTEERRGTTTADLKFTTDGRENVNVVNGNEFRSRSRWEAGKLVTLVTGDRGLSMTEVRYLSPDGKWQTVETHMGDVHGEPQMRRVMERKSR